MNSNVLIKSETLPPCPAVQNNIVFCVTCLSTSDLRKMYSIVDITDKTFFSSITTIQAPIDNIIKVCWECKGMLAKIKRFRMRALKANHVLSINLYRRPDPLSTLVKKDLEGCLSVVHEPITVNKPNQELDMEEITIHVNIKNETLKLEAQDANSIDEDQFSLHTEIEIKMEEDLKTEEEDLKTEAEEDSMDIVKSEIKISEDDNPVLNTGEAKTHLVIAEQDNSDTDSFPELPLQTPIKKTIVNPTQNILRNQRIQRRDDASNSAGGPLVYPSCSQNNDLLKPESSTHTSTKEPTKYILPRPIDQLVAPSQYHSGPKLFKFSPQLALPEMFRKLEQPKPLTYEIRTMTEEQLKEYRSQRQKLARDRHWQFFCERCVDKFNRKNNYEAHMKGHDESAGPYQCDICEFRFPTGKELEDHREQHYKVYFCIKCNLEFYTMKLLLRHNYFFHETVLRHCRHCDQKFTNKREFYVHNKTHIQTVNCEICFKEMKRTHMTQHIKDYHSPLENLECDICQKTILGKKAMASHLRSAHKPVEERSYCVECDVTFKTQALYLTHMKNNLKHRSERDQFKCPICERKFGNKCYLKKHIVVQHEDGEISQCDICKKTFRSKKSVRSHIMAVHLMKTVERNKICEICGKTFVNKAGLDQHRNSHLNIRPYKCSECDATFSYSGARYTHVRHKHRKPSDGVTTGKSVAKRNRSKRTRKRKDVDKKSEV